jgi:hypothetical protein
VPLIRGPLADRDYLEILKTPATVTILEVGIGNALKESCKFFAGLKAVDGRVAAHGDRGHVVQRGNAIAIYGIKGFGVCLEESAYLVSESRISHGSPQQYAIGALFAPPNAPVLPRSARGLAASLTRRATSIHAEYFSQSSEISERNPAEQPEAGPNSADLSQTFLEQGLLVGAERLTVLADGYHNHTELANEFC